MATDARSAALLVLATFALGCARPDYAAIAEIHGKNQLFLFTYEAQLCLSDPAEARKFVEDAMPASREEREKSLDEVVEQGECGLPGELRDTGRAKRWAQREFFRAQARTENLPREQRNMLLTAEVERIDQEFALRAGAARDRYAALNALQLKLIEGIRALRKNGNGVQEYLELPWWKRLFHQAKGLDDEKLRAIGDDLEGLSR